MKNKTAKATFWSLADTYAGFALKFFFAVAITRLLTPRDYGLVAYMGLFIGIANWLSEFGFGTALIQKKMPSNSDFSTGYIFNILVSAFFFILYFFIAPYVANFFNEPELKDIMRITSINLLLNALCYIHQIKLIKSIEFKKLTIVNFGSSVFSGIMGLTLALNGYNYWALIIQTLTGNICRMIGLWYIVKWIPKLKFSWLSFKEQFRFGSRVFITGLLDSIFREIHSIIIGKYYQTASLGNYSRGKKFYDLFIVQTGIAFNKVLYPTMVNKTDKLNEHKNIYLKTYNLLFFVMAPISIFLILMAKPIVVVLLTENWLGAVPFMQLYFIAGFTFMLTYFNSSTILSLNRPNEYLYMNIIQKILFGIALLITYKHGISVIIAGWLLALYIHFLMYEFLMHKCKYYERFKYLSMLGVIFCSVPYIIIYYFISNIVTNNYILLISNALIYPLSYLFMMSLFKIKVYDDFKGILIPIIPKVFSKR